MTSNASPLPEASLPTATTQPAVARQPFTLNALRLVAAAAGLGLLAAYALVGRSLGLNVAILAALGVVALVGLALLERVRPSWRSAWLVVPLLFFAAAVAWRANPLLQLLNLGAALGLALLVARVFTRRDGLSQGIGASLGLVASGAFEAGLLQPADALTAAARQSRTPGQSARGWALVRGLLLAAPVLIVLTALLTLADLAFNQAVLDVLRALGLDDLALLTVRGIFAALAAWAALGLLTLALRPRSAPAAATTPQASISGWRFLGFTEAGVVLGSVNALFLAFGAVQAHYLFGGVANITALGYTYADYARRGFGELVLVALIVLALGLALQATTHRAGRPAILGFRALILLLVLQTGVLLASAFTRMQLYEEAYGFTQLRVSVQVFMIWLAVLLVLYGLMVAIDRPHLIALGGLVSALGFIATLDVINLDGLIARENIARDILARDLVQSSNAIDVPRRYDGDLDYVYVLSLSDDAVPALVALLEHPEVDVRNAAEVELSVRYQSLAGLHDKHGWWGWNWGRQAAILALALHGGLDDPSRP